MGLTISLHSSTQSGREPISERWHTKSVANLGSAHQKPPRLRFAREATYRDAAIHRALIITPDEEEDHGRDERKCRDANDVLPLEPPQGLGVVPPVDDQKYVDGHDERPQHVCDGEPEKPRLLANLARFGPSAVGPSPGEHTSD